MIQKLLLLLSLGVAGHALELDFSGWKKFIDEESDGYKKTAYSSNDELGNFQVTYVSHVSQRRHEYSYVQSITIGLKGTETVLADVLLSYDKNGQYFEGFSIDKADWHVRYGRYQGPGKISEEESVVVTEPTKGPKKGQQLIFVRRNGLFVIFDPNKISDAKF